MLPLVSEGPAAAQGGLLVDFSNSGGHAVLLLKAGQLPTLLDADFVLRSEELVKGEQARQQPLLSMHSVLPPALRLTSHQRWVPMHVGH